MERGFERNVVERGRKKCLSGWKKKSYICHVKPTGMNIHKMMFVRILHGCAYSTLQNLQLQYADVQL